MKHGAKMQQLKKRNVAPQVFRGPPGFGAEMHQNPEDLFLLFRGKGRKSAADAAFEAFEKGERSLARDLLNNKKQKPCIDCVRIARTRAWRNGAGRARPARHMKREVDVWNRQKRRSN